MYCISWVKFTICFCEKAFEIRQFSLESVKIATKRILAYLKLTKYHTLKMLARPKLIEWNSV